MKVSRQEDYAITFVAALLKENGQKRYHALSAIAKRYQLPAAFLRKIAAILKTAGVVRVKEGRSGGYRLVGSPQSLTLGKVLDAVSPGLLLSGCVSADHGRRCLIYNHCPSRLAWQTVTQRLARDLSKIPFQQFLNNR